MPWSMGETPSTRIAWGIVQISTILTHSDFVEFFKINIVSLLDKLDKLLYKLKVKIN